jgi:dTDP-4-dehydrorhamnose reductase
MIALVFGSRGQLGRALEAVRPEGVELVARDLPQIDVTDADAVMRQIGDSAAQLVINATGYTAVDRAENDEAAARRLNADAVKSMAQAAARHGARFIHVSTDFVFDGAIGRPYRPDDPASPLGAYGRTKLEGEHLALSNCADTLVVRTAWLYGDEGANFVHTMLRLMSTTPEVRVICDQVGTPTYARSLAAALWALRESDARGLLHYTDSGVASWYDFAIAIQEEALRLGLLKAAVPILPVSTAEYPTSARRPSFSVLDKSRTWPLLGGPAAHWRVNLRAMLERLKVA